MSPNLSMAPSSDGTEAILSQGTALSQYTTGGFNDPNLFNPTTSAGQFLQMANRGSRGFFTYSRNPDDVYHGTASFQTAFDGSPVEVAVTATMLMIQTGSYPLRETLTGADLQLPGGAGAFYDVYTVGPPDAPLPGQRIVNVPGSNVFYYSPYHYNPGPGVPNAYVQFILNPN